MIPKWGILNLLPCLIPILFFVSLCSSWFDLKVVCLYSFQKELDLTLTTVATIHMFRKISSPGNIGSGTSPSVFIFERIVILCFVSFLYIVKNFIQASQFFFVGGVQGEKKTWRSNILLALKHVLYRNTHLPGKLVMSDR